MVYDTRGMIQHYKRIYNAKPSPEIARTRASSATAKLRPRTGSSSRELSRRSTSFQSLQEPVWFSDGFNSRQGDWSEDADGGWMGNGGNDRRQLNEFSRPQRPQGQTDFVQNRRRPFSANVSRLNGSSGQLNVERQALPKPRPMSAAQSKPETRPRRRRLLRPSSTSGGHYQSSSSAAEEGHLHQRLNLNAKSPYASDQHLTHDRMLMAKRFSSMHDLNGLGVQPSMSSMDQVGLRRTTSLSDRIDSFLQAVHKEEEQQLLLQQHRQAQMRGRTSSNRPSMSSVGNLSSRKTSTAFSVSSLPSKNHYQLHRPVIRPKPVQEVPRPPRPVDNRPPPRQLQTRQRRPAAKPTRKPATPIPAPIDTNNVVSKLKQDRNYQPPRQKRQQPIHSQEMIQRQQSQQHSSSDNCEDYEDDFEAEEELEEDEDTDTAMMRKKQAWLYDQFRRVRARQRAALMVKRQESGAEKASSKDSAYGYSGGETSRLHTREPTPDYQVHGARSSSQQQMPIRPGIKQRIIPNHRLQRSPQPNSQRNPLVPKHMTETEGKLKVTMTCIQIAMMNCKICLKFAFVKKEVIRISNISESLRFEQKVLIGGLNI